MQGRPWARAKTSACASISTEACSSKDLKSLSRTPFPAEEGLEALHVTEAPEGPLEEHAVVPREHPGDLGLVASNEALHGVPPAGAARI